MKKDFDCIEMKRRGQEALQRRLADMTREQQLEFWARRTHELREAQKRAIEQRKTA